MSYPFVDGLHASLRDRMPSGRVCCSLLCTSFCATSNTCTQGRTVCCSRGGLHTPGTTDRSGDDDDDDGPTMCKPSTFARTGDCDGATMHTRLSCAKSTDLIGDIVILGVLIGDTGRVRSDTLPC